MGALATVAIITHVLAAIVWVGGMFFAHQVLRPAVPPIEAGPRQQLWTRVLARFFNWVIAAIIVLLVSGFAIVFGVFGGFADVGHYVHLMMGLGIIMMLLFFHLYFAPWPRFRAAVARQDWTEGQRQLDQIRRIVGINLVLGLVTAAIGASGRYWG